MPKISIIVPVYNVELYVEDCLMSVKNQSFKDFEVIVVNDGSTDSSLSVVEKVIAGDSRFIIISQENSGLSVARNTGLKYATGDYVAFLDSDDKFSANSLGSMAECCSENKLDMLVYEADVFYEKQLENIQKFNYERPSALYNRIVTGQNFFQISINEEQYRPSACMFWVKTDIAKRNLFLPGITHEDNLFTTEILLDQECERLMLVEMIVYLRRVREGSIMMMRPSAKNYIGYLEVYKKLSKQLVILNSNKQIKDALVKFRVSLFFNFTRTLVIVHGLRVPVKMRLEVLKCLREDYGFLMKIIILSTAILPFTMVSLKRILNLLGRFFK